MRYKLISILSLIFFWSTKAFARGGGGGSGGGGGGGGGGFGGSGGGGSSGPFPWFLFVAFIVIVIITSYYSKLKAKKKAQELKQEIAKASTSDSSWKEDSLNKRISEVFFSFQKDWSDLNTKNMRDYMTEGYYKRIVLELNVLQNEHRQNLMENIKLENISIESIHDNDGKQNDSFTANIFARANDSLVDTDTKEKLYTDSNYFTEYWDFVREGEDWKLNLIRQATESPLSIFNEIKDFADKNNFFFDPDFGWLMMPNKGVIFSQNNFLDSDINNHVVGYYKNKIVEFYTFIPDTSTNNPMNYIVAQIVLPISYKDILVRRKRWLFNFAPYGLRRIETESNDFNKKFCLWADKADQISSFELLAPDFMEKIYDLPFELNIEIVGNFLYFYSKQKPAYVFSKREDTVNYDKMLEILSDAFESMKQ